MSALHEASLYRLWKSLSELVRATVYVFSYAGVLITIDFTTLAIDLPIRHLWYTRDFWCS